jgi:4-hydroxy-tetrahydrodipicolinate synthase
MKGLKGTGVAIVTPFKNDASIDFVALGTTGESATITRDEKQAIIAYVKECIDKRVPLIVGIGGNNTQEVINNIRHTDFSMIDGILSVAPYYNKPTQRGIFQHFKAIATCCPVPVILYNVPGRTSSNITAETCLELAHEFDNITAIKEASADMVQIMKIIKGKPENFNVISGDDFLTLPIIAAGGYGVISVLANAFPSQCSEMVNSALKNNFKQAREIQYQLLEMTELLFTEGNPCGIKAMLNVMNICQNVLRLPLVTVSRTTSARIQKAIDETNKR